MKKKSQISLSLSSFVRCFSVILSLNINITIVELTVELHSQYMPSYLRAFKLNPVGISSTKAKSFERGQKWW